MKKPVKRKIAFIFYPDSTADAPLDTMPFAIHIVEQLTANGWSVDMFVWNETGYSHEQRVLPERLRIKHMKTHTRRAKVHAAELALQFSRCSGYRCVFSIGQKGSFAGGVISVASRCPHVILNDEFPFPWARPIWAYLERWSAHRADLIIVPSDERQMKLRELLDIAESTRFVTLRNTARLTEPLIDLNWHHRFGIPDGKRIFISAGYLADTTQVPELITSVPWWPQDTVLLLHSHNKERSLQYRKQLSHLEIPGRVFWNHEPLPQDLLHSLIRHCDGSFGLYRNDGINTELNGTSSGKIMRSIVCGTPVIASNFKSFDFVTREGLGIQVNHPSEIAPAIANLIANKAMYRTRCAAFSVREQSLRDQAWARIVEHVKQSSDQLDLSSPVGAPAAPAQTACSSGR